MDHERGVVEMRDHRKPPKPEAWDAESGICRWCGCCIYHKDGRPAFGRNWHYKCVEEYRVIFWPQSTVRMLLKRRGWKCEDCGVDFNDPACWKVEGVSYEHHHIIPLVDYVHDPADLYAAWKEGNLALLCHECHQERHRILRQEKKPQMRLAV